MIDIYKSPCGSDGFTKSIIEVIGEQVFYAVKSTKGDLIFDQYKDDIQQPIDVE